MAASGHGQARVIDVSGYKRARYVSDIFEWIITATGRVYKRAYFNYCRSTKIGSFITGRSRWAYQGTKRTLRGGFGVFLPTTLPGEYAREFRAAYRVHAAVPKGITTFAGKRVKSFQSMEAYLGAALVYWRPGTPPPVRVRNAHPLYALVDVYIDRATAELVGFETRAERSPGRPMNHN